jgi:hypothetical protein
MPYQQNHCSCKKYKSQGSFSRLFELLQGAGDMACLNSTPAASSALCAETA